MTPEALTWIRTQHRAVGPWRMAAILGVAEADIKAVIEGGTPCPGGSSSTSESTPSRSSSGTRTARRSPAPTTASRSGRPRQPIQAANASSTAPTTGGSTPVTGSGRKDSKAG